MSEAKRNMQMIYCNLKSTKFCIFTAAKEDKKFPTKLFFWEAHVLLDHK